MCWPRLRAPNIGDVSAISFRAVIVGSLVDITGSIVVGGAVLAFVAALQGATTAEQMAAMFDASAGLQLLSMVLGLFFVSVGGYVAARLARGAERANAFAVGVLSTAVSFLIVFNAPETAPFWYEAVSLVLTVPAAFLGGEFRLLTLRGRKSGA